MRLYGSSPINSTINSTTVVELADASSLKLQTVPKSIIRPQSVTSSPKNVLFVFVFLKATHLAEPQNGFKDHVSLGLYHFCAVHE